MPPVSKLGSDYRDVTSSHCSSVQNQFLIHLPSDLTSILYLLAEAHSHVCILGFDLRMLLHYAIGCALMRYILSSALLVLKYHVRVITSGSKKNMGGDRWSNKINIQPFFLFLKPIGIILTLGRGAEAPLNLLVRVIVTYINCFRKCLCTQ